MCGLCGHQTSLTAATLIEGHTASRSPYGFMLSGIVCVHKHGISAQDLQRVMGFGPYETAWTWLHKIRRALVEQAHQPLAGVVEINEGFIGGKGLTTKSVALVASEREPYSLCPSSLE